MPSYSGVWTLPAQMQARGQGLWPIAPAYWIGLLTTTSTTGGQGYGSTVDSNNNAYYCGSTSTSGVVAKYDSGGTLQWQRTLDSGGGTGSTVIRRVVTDSSGNVYCCAYDDYYFYIVKYNSSGTLQWQRSLYNGNSPQVGLGVALDSASNVIISGRLNIGGTYYGFLAKYNSSGVIQWQRSYNSTNAGMFGVSVDGSNNVYSVGYGGGYGYVLKFDSSGTLQWQRRFGGLDTNEIYDCKTDSAGNTYMCGYTKQVPSGSRWVIVKYDTSGNLTWVTSLGDANFANAWGIGLTSSYVYVSGWARISGLDQAVIAQYDTNGSLQWKNALSSADGSNNYSGISADSSGNPVFCGTRIAFGTGGLYVTKLYADGSGGGTYTVNGNSITYGFVSLSTNGTTITGSTASGTVATTSLTDAAGALTGATGTMTSSITKI